ncbi:pancreatic lipase-related protein 2-like [Bufo bufo]|uniref:pancreatic lipase-related protein 2-like n=1 Tax=Bufo bufo TaxID=8384 RepID=UPI001ABE1529|nr:pancreatic lipase-related protein 2-like [Bufo bufo]
MDMSYLNFCCCLQIMAGVLPVLSALSIFKDETVCYNRLGCFTNKNPWSRTLERPISRLPWAPEKINTRFLLYTRNNLNKPQVVTAVDHSTIATSNFQTHLKSHIIIHGFINSGEDSWLVNMCQAMLQVEDVNCFCTDWSGGSQTLYTQAANNIRVVGAEVAYLVNTLLEAFKYPLSKVHIIGHSLGAHAAGEAGKRQPGIGRITGLDPAQPYFQDTPPEVRLDPSDAILVDAIHTDITSTILNLGTGGYGMSQTVGHLDFFPNGGRQMPGCKKNQVISHVNIDDVTPVINELVCCNHMRSYQYYTESIRSPDGFIGFPSSSYDEYLGGAGFPCPSGGCPWMGHYADQYRGITSNTQTFYLNTGERNSFSRWRYMASVQTAGNSKILGNIAISVQGSNGKTSEYTISRGIIMSDKTYTDFIDVEVDIGSISTVTFVWRSSLPNLLRRKLGASIVTLHYGKDRAVTSFCDSETVLDTVFQTLRPCGSTLPV